MVANEVVCTWVNYLGTPDVSKICIWFSYPNCQMVHMGKSKTNDWNMNKDYYDNIKL